MGGTREETVAEFNGTIDQKGGSNTILVTVNAGG